MKHLASPGRIAILILVTALLAYSLGAQGSPLPARGWPPLPGNIVNLSSTTAPLGPGSSEVIYTVPSDRYLIVTNIAWSAPTSPPASLNEDTAGVLVQKADVSTMPYGGQINGYSSSGAGLTFMPGSKVTIKIDNNANPQPGPVKYLLTGYLAAP